MRQEATVRLHTSQVMNANQRLHFRKEAQMKQTLVQFGRLALGRGMAKVTVRALVTFEFTFPSKRNRDRANYHPTVKHLLDGIVLSGALMDDSDAYIDGPDIVIRDELSGIPGTVLVKVVIEDTRSARRARLVAAEAEIMRERDVAARAKEIRDAAKKAERKAKRK